MRQHIVIERLEFPGHCGVTAEERTAPQPIGVDLELEYASERFLEVATTDDIRQAVDYATVTRKVLEIGTKEEFHLLETFADRVCRALFAEFPIAHVRLWIRKLSPPVQGVEGAVGVRVERIRPESSGTGEGALPPAAFLVDHAARLPRGQALDVAAGRGRNALYMAALDYTVEAVDRDTAALSELAASARERQLTRLHTRHLDLEDTQHPPDISAARYDVILVFFYLHRPLFPILLQALKPGGVLMYETFLIENHLRRHHPRRREFCLEDNELLRLTSGLRVLSYDEGEHQIVRATTQEADRAFTARLLAQRPALSTRHSGDPLLPLNATGGQH